MTEAQQKFCVLTTGRSGSTALMNRLETFEDIALPNKNIDCVDNELLHPREIKKYAHEYSRLCKATITTQDQLMQNFFDYNADFPFAGFKSMPNRHTTYDTFIHRKDVTFIVLIREDIPSTVASFLLAMRTDSWRRSGESPKTQLTFGKDDARQALGNLGYIHQSMVQLSQVPDPIRLTYEDLCDPAFECPALDAFFARPLRIDNPRPPTSGRDYVSNWDEFEAFIAKAYKDMSARGVRRAPAGNRTPAR